MFIFVVSHLFLFLQFYNWSYRVLHFYFLQATACSFSLVYSILVKMYFASSTRKIVKKKFFSLHIKDLLLLMFRLLKLPYISSIFKYINRYFFKSASSFKYLPFTYIGIDIWVAFFNVCKLSGLDKKIHFRIMYFINKMQQEKSG